VDFDKIFGGIGLLILVFLLLSRAEETNTVVSALAQALTSNIRALQGLTPTGALGTPGFQLAR
jgi:hypothetical protein